MKKKNLTIVIYNIFPLFFVHSTFPDFRDTPESRTEKKIRTEEGMYSSGEEEFLAFSDIPYAVMNNVPNSPRLLVLITLPEIILFYSTLCLL